MKNAVLTIEGIECWSYHGCLPEETKIGGRFMVDVILEIDLHKAMETDDLKQTADYKIIHDLVRAEMAIPSQLIEAVAGRILKKTKTTFPLAVRTTVRVIKFNPPVNGSINKAIIEISL